MRGVQSLDGIQLLQWRNVNGWVVPIYWAGLRIFMLRERCSGLIYGVFYYVVKFRPCSLHGVKPQHLAWDIQAVGCTGRAPVVRSITFNAVSAIILILLSSWQQSQQAYWIRQYYYSTRSTARSISCSRVYSQGITHSDCFKVHYTVLQQLLVDHADNASLW